MLFAFSFRDVSKVVGVMLCAAAFGESVAVDWADYAGQTYTVAAGAEVTVAESDMGAFNKIAAVSFADATGKVVFDGCLTAPNVEVSGAGTIEKRGNGIWSLSRQLPNFTGPYLVSGGLVSMAANDVLGALSVSGGNIVVADGATLCVSNSAVHFKSRLVRFAGSGFGTAGGALTIYCGTDATADMFRLGWSLDGDASVFVSEGSGPYLKTRLDLNGHTLRKFGTGHLMHTGGKVNGGAVIVEPGESDSKRTSYTLRESGVVARANPLTPLYLNNFSYLRFWNDDPPQDGPLYASGDVKIMRYNQGSSTYLVETPAKNNWLGPIVMSNAETKITFTHAGGDKTGGPAFTNRLHVTGCISGPGSIVATGHGRLYLDCPTNAWTGTTRFDRMSDFSRIILGAPGSVPDYSKFSVNGAGTRVNLASNLWTFGSVVRLLNEATYTASTTRGVAFDTTCVTDRTDFVVSGADAVALTNTTQFLDMSEVGKTVTITGGTDVIEMPKLIVGGGTLRLAGSTTQVKLCNKTVVGAMATDDWATLRIEDGADVEIPSNELVNPLVIGKPDSGTVTNPKSRIVVSNATLRTEHWKRAYLKSATNAFLLGSATSRALLETYDGALVSNKFVMGGSATTIAAVHQHGGTISAFGDWGGSLATATIIGYYFGHAYWLIEDGRMEGLGSMCLGQNNATAVFEMRGGTYDQFSYNDDKKYTGFYVASSSGGCRASLICRGTSRFNGSYIILGTGTTSGQPGSEGVLTVADDAQVKIGYCTLCAVNAESRGLVNLNGGVLETDYIVGNKLNSQYNAGAWPEVMAVNFNGGTLRCTRDGYAVFSYRNEPERAGNSATPRVFVYKGGATFDVPAGNKVYIYPPLERPYGGGVESIAWTSTDYAVAPPVVRIEGDGTGASAVCDYDPASGLVTNVTVTSRGNGYTWAKAYFITGSTKAITRNPLVCATVDCTITSNESGLEQSGGVTKVGAGQLVLQATNDWKGVTTVAGGALQANVDYAIPSNACVRLAGGTLNLNGKLAYVTNLVYAAGGGQVVNAGAATLPATFSLETTIEDIVADRAIALVGNVDLNGISLTIEGSDFSALDKTKKGGYSVVTTTGTLSGTPVLTAEALPPNWIYRKHGNTINLAYPKGVVVIVK